MSPHTIVSRKHQRLSALCDVVLGIQSGF